MCNTCVSHTRVAEGARIVPGVLGASDGGFTREPDERVPGRYAVTEVSQPVARPATCSTAVARDWVSLRTLYRECTVPGVHCTGSGHAVGPQSPEQLTGALRALYREYTDERVTCPAGHGAGGGGGGDGADVMSMAGTLVISLVCQLLALIMCALEYRYGRCAYTCIHAEGKTGPEFMRTMCVCVYVCMYVVFTHVRTDPAGFPPCVVKCVLL